MRVLLVVEGKADRRRVGWLIDRWLGESVEWLDPDRLDLYRSFEEVEPGRDYLPITRIPLLYRQRGGGGFGGGGFGRAHPSGDAGLIHDLRIIIARHELEPDVIVWVRDADTSGTREGEAIAEVDRAGEGDRFVIGYAYQTSEAWVLAGWQATSPAEARAEKAVEGATTRKVPRDAHLFPHQTSVPDNAKWAVAELMPDFDRQEAALARAWGLPDGEVQRCGLADFRRALARGLGRAFGVARGPHSEGG